MVDDMHSLRCWLEDKALAEHIKTCQLTPYPKDIEMARGKMEAFREVIHYIETRNHNQRPHINFDPAE